MGAMTRGIRHMAQTTSVSEFVAPQPEQVQPTVTLGQADPATGGAWLDIGAWGATGGGVGPRKGAPTSIARVAVPQFGHLTELPA